MRRTLRLAATRCVLSAVAIVATTSFASAQFGSQAPVELSPASRSGARVVVKVNSPIFLLPDGNREPLRIAKAGSTLRAVDRTADWTQVEFQDPQYGRRTGYILSRNVESADPPAPIEAPSTTSAVRPPAPPVASGVVNAPASAPAPESAQARVRPAGQAPPENAAPSAPPETASDQPQARVRPAGQAPTESAQEQPRARVRTGSGNRPRRADHETAWINVDAARYRSRQDSLTVSHTSPLYLETLSAAAVYPLLPAVTDLALSGGFTLGSHAGINVSFDGQNYTETVGLGLTVPSPYRFNTPGTDVGVTSSTLARKDRAINFSLVYNATPGARASVRLFAGPTYFRVSNEMVRTIRYTQSASVLLPINIVDITSFTTDTLTASRVGFNAGVDVGYFFARHVGVGGGLKFNRGTVNVEDPLSGVVTPLSAGHLEAGGGLRLRF